MMIVWKFGCGGKKGSGPVGLMPHKKPLQS